MIKVNIGEKCLLILGAQPDMTQGLIFQSIFISILQVPSHSYLYSTIPFNFSYTWSQFFCKFGPRYPRNNIQKIKNKECPLYERFGLCDLPRITDKLQDRNTDKIQLSLPGQHHDLGHHTPPTSAINEGGTLIDSSFIHCITHTHNKTIVIMCTKRVMGSVGKIIRNRVLDNIKIFLSIVVSSIFSGSLCKGKRKQRIKAIN